MRFADLVATAGAVAAAPGRRRKVALLADLLMRMGGDEVAVGAGLLAGEPRQGRLGVGCQTVESVEVIPAAEPSLELLARETRREGNDVWVRPELVVEVAFDGVQASSRYAGGVTLRFDRVLRYRDTQRRLLRHQGPPARQQPVSA